MRRLLRAHLKKMLGPKYERALKTLFVWPVLYMGFRSLQIQIDIAPIVIVFATALTTVFSFTQALHSEEAIHSLRGMLLLPEKKTTFHLAYALSLAIYTLLSKAGYWLIAYFVFSTPRWTGVIGFVLSFLLSAAVTYPLAFQREPMEKQIVKPGTVHAGFFVYLLRYCFSHKNYLVNSLILWGFGCAFAFISLQGGISTALPFGMVMMCFNTPLGTILSSDPALYRQVRLLPNQTKTVLAPYVLFVLCVNGIACSLYGVFCMLLTGHFWGWFLFFGYCNAILSAVLTVAMERFFPILNWNVENDLWHHPRKYVVPSLLMLLSLPVSILSGGQ